MDSKLLEFKTKALEDNIPIMRDEVIDYIKKLITNYKLKNILEIGTAVGYSAVNFALTKSDVKITTIERDQKRFLAAVKNVKSFGLEDRIELVLSDALETSLDTEEKFDLIIIDAAKGKNIDFFNKFKENLKIGGLIITDNTLFHGLVGNSETIESKNLRSLVKKIEKYIEFLKTNEEYETVFLELGDGIAISKKRN